MSTESKSKSKSKSKSVTALLVHSQLPLVLRPFAVATLVGIAFGPLSEPREVWANGYLLGMTLVVLAGVLAAALFAAKPGAGQAMWMRSLPIALSRVFAVKVGVGLGVLLASFVAVGIVWTLRVPALWTPRARLLPPFDWMGGTVELSLSLLAFAAAAFLANSFERVVASQQAGVAGLASLLGIWIAVRDVPGDVPFSAVALPLAALGLLAAYRLFRRRSVHAATAEEKVLGDPRAVDAPVLVLAQLAFVVVPLAYLVRGVAPDLRAWNGPGPRVFASVGFVLAGLALLPWAVRQARAHGLSLAGGAAVVALSATGLGASLWKVVRRKGPIARCSRCGRVRRVGLERCPACGARAHGRSIGSDRPLRRVPCTPASWFLVLLIAWGAQLGNVRFLHVWEIECDNPRGEILLDGEVLGSGGRAAGWALGPVLLPRSPWSGLQGSVFRHAAFEDAPRERVDLAELADRLGRAEGDLDPLLSDSWWTEAGELSPREHFAVVFGGGRELSVRVPESEAVITWVGSRAETHTLRTELALDLRTDYPFVNERVEELLARVRQRELTTDEVGELARGFELVLVRWRSIGAGARVTLKNAPSSPRATTGIEIRSDAWRVDEGTDPEVRRRVLDAIDRVLRVRFELDTEVGLRNLWEQLDAELASGYVPGVPGPAVFLPDLHRDRYPKLRALALGAAAGRELLVERLREGDPLAAVVALMARDPALFDELLAALDRTKPEPWSASSSTLRADDARPILALALLASDAKRGRDVLYERLRGALDRELLAVVPAAGDPRFGDLIGACVELSDLELAKRLGLYRLHDARRARDWLSGARVLLDWKLEPGDWLENHIGFVQDQVGENAGGEPE